MMVHASLLGMYVRSIKRKNRDGSEVEYLQLAHNVWDPESKQSKARVFYSFGRREQLDVEAVRRLVDSLARLLDSTESAEVRAKLEKSEGLEFLGARSAGGGYLLRRMWEKLGLRRVFEDSVKERQFRMSVEHAIFAMVANRALAPSSKWTIPEWLREDAALDGIEDVEEQHCYRAMDVLHAQADAIQREVFRSVADILNLEVDLLFFDTTSTYFETEDESPIKRFGHSKDHRADQPQVVIGMAVTRDGLPVRVWVFPGNTADASVVPQIKDDLRGWRLNRVVWVCDSGFTSTDNLRELQKGGAHYIVGERMRDGQQVHEEALSRQGRYQKVNDRVEVKEITVGEGEQRRRFVLVRNPRQAERDAATRKATLERLAEQLKGLGKLSGSKQDEAFGRLKAHASLGRFLTSDGKGCPCIDRKRVKDEERLDGKYLLSTSDEGLSAADVALGYKQLLEIEDAWRTLKTTLELRPVFHRRDDRIVSHVLICWLALLLVRVIERATGESWTQTRKELNRLTLGRFGGSAGVVERYSTPTAKQIAIFNAVGVDRPPKFLKLAPA